MNLILLGAPGAGKGTQGEFLSQRLSIPVISTGNIIREAVKNETEMGLAAKSFIDEGRLVPDETIIGILGERLAMEDCAYGYILDGVPRTVVQADAIAKMGVVIDKVISIEVPDEEILGRLGGRRVCPSCGATYHILHNPSETEGVCDKCGAELIIRKDDSEETIKERLRVFHELTEPLKDYYKKLGKLRLVEGVGTVDEISRLMLQALEA